MKLGIVTDTHLAPADAPPSQFQNPYDFANVRARFRQALERHRNAGVDAVVHLGDLVNGPHATEMREGLALLAGAGMPALVLSGNHDVEQGATAFAAEVAAAGLATPSAAGQRRGALRLAGLAAVDTGDADVWRVVEPAIAAWGDEPVLLLCHFPPLCRRAEIEAAGFKYAGDVVNLDHIGALLAGRRAPTVVLHGHLHVRTALTRGALLQIGFAAMIEPPHEPATVTIAADGDLTVRVTRHPEATPGVRVPILTPERAGWRFDGGAWVAREEDQG